MAAAASGRSFPAASPHCWHLPHSHLTCTPHPTPGTPSLQQAHYQAARCLYVAHSLLAAQKPGEAAALFGRAAERCKQAARCAGLRACMGV